MNFIDLFLEHTKELESPTSFFKWAAFACVSAVLRDNAHIVMESNRKIYPNLFVLLVADSAVSRKSVPVSMIHDIVKTIQNTKIIAGRSSIEAILDRLAEAETKNGHGMLKGGSCLLCAEELLSFFVTSDSLVPLLTDMYDFRAEWESRLRGNTPGGSVFKINNMCVSMLAASNETHLRQIYTGMAVHGGLLGRTLLIRSDENRKGNSLFRASDDPLLLELKSNADIIANLKTISSLRGPAFQDKSAAQAYDDWYLPMKESYIHKPDPSGVIGRIHTTVLKLALILGVSREYKLVIQKQDIERAIDECTSILKNYEMFILGSGKSTIAEIGSIFLLSLYKGQGHSLTRKEVMRNHWGEFDAEMLDKIVISLETGGMLKTFISNTETKYQMTAECIAIFERKNGKETVH